MQFRVFRGSFQNPQRFEMTGHLLFELGELGIDFGHLFEIGFDIDIFLLFEGVSSSIVIAQNRLFTSSVRV